MENTNKGIMKVKDVAERFGIRVETVRTWVRTKQIPYYKIGGSIYFLSEELNKWFISKKEVESE